MDTRAVILVCEMMWTGPIHAPGNSATIQVIARAFPGQEVRVLADSSHLAELHRDPALTGLANVDFHRIDVSPTLAENGFCGDAADAAGRE